MIICLFGQRYREGADLKEEARIGGELLGELQRMPGFISYHGYTAEDGEVLGVIRFESREALEAWRDNPIHQAVWDRANEFYEEFWIQNADSYREYTWAHGERRDGDLRQRFRAENVSASYRPETVSRSA
jgi:heme-degrading monooxygenase HmoA